MAFYLITSASTFPYFQIDRFTNQCRLQTNRNKEHILKIFLSVAFVIMTTGCIKNCKPLKSVSSTIFSFLASKLLMLKLGERPLL